MEGFRNDLGRIGFNDPTCQEISDNGFSSISSIATVEDEDISDLVKPIGRRRGAPAPVAARQPAPVLINIPSISVKKKAMRYAHVGYSTKTQR